MDKGIRNICIYGVGGVGGYFGTKIIKQRKEGDFKVTFVARGKHLEGIKKNGLMLNTENQTINVFPDYIEENISKCKDLDLALICVKSYDLERVLEDIKEKVEDHTIIVPLLNGVDIYERIRRKIKKGMVLPACVYVGTHIKSPGVVQQRGGEGKIIFGKDPQKPNYYPDEVIQLFDKVKLHYSYEENPYSEIWSKYIFIAAYGLVTAYTGKTLGEVYENKTLRSDVNEIMREIVRIAEKKGIDLDKDIVSKSLDKAQMFPFEAKTSFQRDIEEGKKKNEGELFGETIIRMGQEYGVDVSTTKKYHKY